MSYLAEGETDGITVTDGDGFAVGFGGFGAEAGEGLDRRLAETASGGAFLQNADAAHIAFLVDKEFEYHLSLNTGTLGY
jgi:hypothetical protein